MTSVSRQPGTLDADRGDTLIELLVAVVIIGLVVGAMFNGLMSVTRGSTVHRSTANVDTLAKSYLEAAVQQIEAPSGGLFSECASSYAVVWTNPSAYVGYASPSIKSITFWNPATQSFGTSCTGTTKNGLQRIQVQAAAPDGSIALVASTVRNPSYSSTDCTALGGGC